MPKEYVGFEQEMDIYASVYLKPPKPVGELLRKVLPEKLARKMAEGVKLREKRPVSWESVYKKLVEEEGGFPQEHQKFGDIRKGVCLDKGDSYYGDYPALIGNSATYPEFCSPLTEVRRGFAEKAKDAIMLGRARALKAAGKGGKIEVSNMHYNFSIEGVKISLDELYGTLGPAYALLLFSDNNCSFHSLRKRASGKKGGGLEIAAPALMDPEQLEAAHVFLAGTLRALASKKDFPARATVSEKPIGFSNEEYDRVVWHDGIDYELPIRKNGPNAVLSTNKGEMAARQYFADYLSHFRQDIEEVATAKELAILDELASGKRKFEIEKRPSHLIDANYIKRVTGKTLDGAIEDFKPTGAAALFADSAKNQVKKIGKLTRRTRHIGWEKITFRFSDGVEEKDIDVPLDRMEEYMDLEGRLPALPELKEKFL